jgi:hypothetical protein
VIAAMRKRTAWKWSNPLARLRRCILGFGLATSFALIGHAASVVTINADKVMVLNGRKVFPITLTPGPPNHSKTPLDDDALTELGQAGVLAFRIAQTVDWNSQLIATQHEALSWAQQNGMYCMVNLRERSAFAAGDSVTEAGLRSLVNEFKNHPALAVWKNKDEAWWGDTSAADLQRGYDVIKQEDPNHPVEQTHAPRGTLADLQPYNTAADILAIDIYPVSVPPGKHSLLPNKEISMVGDWTTFLSDVSDGQNSIWMVEQIAWSGVTPPNVVLFPTFRQSRYMAYQAIVKGARGLMFFGGNVASVMNAQDAPLGWNWTYWNDVLKRVIHEVGDHSPLTKALVAPNSALPITFSGATAPDIEFCVREAAPHLYIIACKREGATANVTFSGLPAWAGTGEVMFESPRTVAAQNGQFTDTFAPFDVHVYRFSQANEVVSVVYPPQGRTRYAGMNVSFHVSADGTGPLSYRWRRNGSDLDNGGDVSGVRSPTLTLASVSSADAGAYDVVINGFGTATSTAAALTVLDYQPNRVPSITTQPQGKSVQPGAEVTFIVVASGNGPFAYRWRKNGANLTNGANVSGATTWSLKLDNVSPFDAASYDVVITGQTSVTSIPATLSVVTQPPQLILYEHFNYSNIGSSVSNNTPANWAFGGTGANDLNVTAGSLSYAGLVHPLGNSVTNGGAGLGVRRLFGTAANNGVLYFSSLFRINDIGTTWNGAASQVGAFTATDNASFRLAVMVQSSPAGYRIGVQKGGTGATPTFGSTEFTAGETVFLVGKYDFTTSPNLAHLWINPNPSTFGAATEPDSGFITAGTGIDGFTIDRFNFRQNTATSVPAGMQWDELRVGRTWLDVTPPPPPLITEIIKLPGGAFQFRYKQGGAQTYSIYATTNLIDWSAVGSATQVAPGVYEFIDPNAANLTQRFYQLRSP